MNTTRTITTLFWVASILLVPACSKQPPQVAAPTQIHVAAAASLAGVLKTLRPLAKEKANVDMLVNAAASGTLAQQILRGAPVDLFISANIKWMDALGKRGVIMHKTRINLAKNNLVLIASKSVKNPPQNLAQLANSKGKIAIGDPSYVPAGKYAKTSLKNAGIWNLINQRIIPTVDVTAALVSVQSGGVPFGFVYATDAQGALDSNTYTICFTVAQKLHKKIVYPAAVIKNCEHVKAALRLLKFLQSKKAQAIFKKAGFAPMSAG